MKVQELNEWFKTMPLNTDEINNLHIPGNIKDAIFSLIAPYVEGITATFVFPNIPENETKVLCKKIFGLCDIIRHADDDAYPHHASKGNIRKVALTTIRYIYQVAVNNQHDPYVTFDNDVINTLGKVFILLYTSNQEEEKRPQLCKAMTDFAVVCLLLANRTEAVKFNVTHPFQGKTQDDVYTATAQYAVKLGIPI